MELNELNPLTIRSNIANMSHVDRHVYLTTIFNDKHIFGSHYVEWTMRRINKVLELYGVDYFKGKHILELGGGIGNIGGFFAELGSDVLALESRSLSVSIAQLKNRNLKNYRCEQFNLENDFSQYGKFDMIINFGLIYHLKNVESHLVCCTKIANNILLEGTVCDSTDPSEVILVDDPEGDDEAFERKGSRPSPYLIERVFEQSGFKTTRCFTKDLNAYAFTYDWEHKNDKSLLATRRRFWDFRK